MKKILITGATDGIGLETARKLKSLGHELLIHGRNPEKLDRIGAELSSPTFQADLSELSQVKKLAKEVLEHTKSLDILINNAGVYKTKNPKAKNGMDIRFVVNTLSPYFLTKTLLPNISSDGRVINLSSAAQSSVNFQALKGNTQLDDFSAYAQSKLALTMWSQHLAHQQNTNGPIVISVNPGSLLGTKMVREGFGTSGNDINIGVNILTELALDEKHLESNGKYFDNDSGQFANPQADGLNLEKTKELISILEEQIGSFS